MENLYYQNPAMTLCADYKAVLLELCCKILEWFESAFACANVFPAGAADFEMQSQRAGAFLQEVKEMDQACQRFNIVVETRGDDGSESDSEGDGVETEESEDDIRDFF